MIDRLTDILMEELADTLDESYASDEKHRLRENMVALARHLVGAMSEPTRAMVQAGSEYCYQPGFGEQPDRSAREDAELCWQAMIDRALERPPIEWPDSGEPR